MNSPNYVESLETPLSAQTAFYQAHRRARWQTMLRRLTGKPNQLRSFDEVRRCLGGATSGARTLQEISLAQVVGSVGRFKDYTPTFLPQRSSDEARWVRIRRVINGMGGLPSIEVYGMAGRYFIKDGHHRVSVLKQLGVKNTEAWVTEMRPLVTKGVQI